MTAVIATAASVVAVRLVARACERPVVDTSKHLEGVVSMPVVSSRTGSARVRK